MGKVLVLYHSASGNTATMARLVAEGAGLIPGTEVRVREVDAATPDDVLWCDGLVHKRSLALGEFALGVEGLERFVRREPLRRVHECVFGVLALESEPVDPRL
jgi:hypothetical protein